MDARLNHRAVLTAGVLAQECGEVLKSFRDALVCCRAKAGETAMKPARIKNRNWAKGVKKTNRWRKGGSRARATPLV